MCPDLMESVVVQAPYLFHIAQKMQPIIEGIGVKF